MQRAEAYIVHYRSTTFVPRKTILMNNVSFFRLLMVFIYLPFMASLLTALVLAARSVHPRQYHGTEGVIQGICEAISLLYIILWLLVIFLLGLVLVFGVH